MKALVFEIRQGRSSLRYSEAPAPELAAGDLLVNVSATSINRADHLLLEGKGPGEAPATNIPGKDFVGFVRQAPGANYPFSEGERVVGVMPTEQFGAHATQISISPRFVARAPEGVPDEILAHAGLAALTALVSIEDSLQVREGETVLIEGAAGGVGGFAVQIAHKRGARVLATAWRGNHDYVRSLGADHVVDPDIGGLDDPRSQCDAVLQTVGGPEALRAFEALKPAGRAAFLGSGPSGPAAPSAFYTSLRPNVERSRSNLDRLAAALRDGELMRSEIRVLPLSEGKEAFAHDRMRHRKGRTVMSIPQ